MERIIAILFGMLTFVSSALADTLQLDVYQCEAVMEGRGASIRSKFIFDGNSGGTSFNYVQSYNVFVYKYTDEKSQDWITFTVDGSVFGNAGYVRYVPEQSSRIPLVSIFNFLKFGTIITVSCEKA